MLRTKDCMKTNVPMPLLQQGTERQRQQGSQNMFPHPYGCFLPIGANWNAWTGPPKVTMMLSRQSYCYSVLGWLNYAKNYVPVYALILMKCSVLILFLKISTYLVNMTHCSFFWLEICICSPSAERREIWEIIKTNISKDPRCCLRKSIQPSYPCPIHAGDSGDLLATVNRLCLLKEEQRGAHEPQFSLLSQDGFQCCTVLHDEFWHFSPRQFPNTLDFPHLHWARKHLVIMQVSCSAQRYSDPG